MSKIIDLENPFHSSNVQKLCIGVTVVGTMLVASFSGTYNAINNLTTMIQSKEGFSNYEISLIQSLCFMGAYFTFVSGLIMDRIGPLVAISIGAIIIITGYFIMAISALLTTGGTAMFVFLLIGYSLVGLGSGTTFLCAMGCSIRTLTNHPGLAVSLPGICMSLSMAFTIWIENGYLQFYGCDDCWGDAIVALLIFVMLFFFFGGWFIAIGLYFTHNTPPPTSIVVDNVINFDDEYDVLYGDSLSFKNRPATLKQLIFIFFNSYYYVLAFGYFCAISYGLIIVSQTTNIWISVTGTSDYVSIISTLFSFANATANVICGLIYDNTVRKGKLSKQVFMVAYFMYCVVTLGSLGVLSFFSSAVQSSSALQIIYATLMISVGFGWGCAFTLFPVLTGEVYGSANFGFNFSVVQLGSFVATFTVPNFAAFIFSHTNGFGVLFLIFTFLLIISGVANFFSKPVEVKAQLPEFVSNLKSKITSN